VYSIVIPVYRNEEALPALLKRLESLNRELADELEAVFVVDGSPDGSHRLLAESLPRFRFRSQLVSLSRNFGSFAAIRQGLAVAEGPYFAVMAADLQEPPELVLEFFRLMREGVADIVVGRRTGRSDPFISALASRMFWGVYRRLIQPEVPQGGVDIFGCTNAVRDMLLRLDESNSSLVGLLFWLGFRRAEVPYERQPRQHGSSGWSTRRKLKYLMDSAFAFTDLPISALLAIGAIGVLASVVVAAFVLIARLSGAITVLGYTPLTLLILFSLSANLFALGIVGSYVWRTFENSKRRPLYVPLSHDVFGKDVER
jgi:glycosyltransferase involved in cell wall biosynthesis